MTGRSASFRVAAGVFAGLGLQVGVWAVLIPHVVATRSLSPAALGGALALMSATSIGALAAAGPVADRAGPRPLAVGGAAGLAAAFALLAGVESATALWPTVALYGVASGCLDLAANAIGSDHERVHRERAMVRLHAGFSAAAAGGALAAGAAGPSMYWAAAALYGTLALALAFAPLPAHERAAHTTGGRRALLGVPAVVLALAIVTLCFFGDGAIEGYAALFLRDVLAAGGLATGAAFAAYHGASLAGRLLSSRVTDERRLVAAAGLLAAAGMGAVVAAGSAALAAAGLLVVGFALAPIVPTALSLAARSAPGRSATAVSLVTTVGYGAFVAGPPLVGALAGLTSLRAALAPVIVSTAAVAALALRPGREP